MCSLKLPVEIMEQIDKYRKHVFWHRGDVTKKGGYLVAWKHACRSKKDGSLGIINLRNHNTALLLKFSTSSTTDWIYRGCNLLGRSFIHLENIHMKESLWALSGGGILCLSAPASSRWLLAKLTVVYRLPSGMTTGIWEL
jgi:hypothetical protein